MTISDRLLDRLPPVRAELLREFISVGEYGLFVDELSATLAKRSIAVTPHEYAQFAELVAEVEGPSYQPGRFLSDIVIRED